LNAIAQGFDEMDEDPDFAILEEFLERWERATTGEERSTIQQSYCERYPHLSHRFHDLIDARRLVSDARDPERLGPYRIASVLAVGGMGKVYEAEDETLARRVAVKTIRLGRAAEPAWLERFECERRVLARLHHTNIVPIYSSGEHEGLLYFAMQLIKGCTLADLVQTLRRSSSAEPWAVPASPSTWKELLDQTMTEAMRARTLRRLTTAPFVPSVPSASPGPQTRPPERISLPRDYLRHVVEIVAVAAEALHAAHEEGIRHFDVKPANILIERVPTPDSPKVHPWIIDFGLADIAASRNGDALDNESTPDASAGPSHRGRRTRGFGTRGFMAPEMLQTRDADRSQGDRRPPLDRYTDVWSLGVTLYQMVTLELPFSADQDVLAQKPPIPPRRLVSGLPRELEAVILKALEKRPEDRYATAALLAQDLRHWLEAKPTVAGQANLRVRLAMWARRRPAAAIASAMTVAFVLASWGVAAQVARNARTEARAAAQAAQAKQRELDMLSLTRLRAPIRRTGWSDDAWVKARALARDGAPGDLDGRLQGEVAQTCEGIDARIVKSFPDDASQIAFNDTSDRLLMVHEGDGPPDRRFRTTLFDRATDQVLVQRDLGPGVVAFRGGGTPLQLSCDLKDQARLRLFDVASGKELHTLGSSLEGLSAITAIALSGDGLHCAAVARPLHQEEGQVKFAGDAVSIMVWDTASGQLVRRLEHQAALDVVFSPDHQLLAAWSDSGEITVWSLPEGRRVTSFRVGRCPVYFLAFGRDPVWSDEKGALGQDGANRSWLLAVGESSGLITVWDLRAGRPRIVCRGSSYEVRSMAFSGDGALLMSTGRNPTKLWDVATGTCLLELPVGNVLNALALAPDGRHLALSRASAFGLTPGVDLMELELGRGMRTLYGLQGVVEKMVVSRDGALIAASTHEWQIGIWDWPTGRLRCVLPAPVGQFADNLAMAFDPSGRRFACSTWDRAELWDLKEERKTGSWKLPAGLSDALAFPRPDQLLLIRQETQSMRGSPTSMSNPRQDPRAVRLYDLLGPTPMKAFAEINDFGLDVRDIQVAGDGSWFVVDGTGIDRGEPVRRLHLYEGKSGRFLHALPLRFEAATGAEFDPTGKIVAAQLNPGPRVFSLFELPAATLLGQIDDYVHCLGPGARLWLNYHDASQDQPIEQVLYDRAGGRPILRVVRDVSARGANCHRFSPDGRYVITGNADGTVTVCDLVEVNRRLSKLRLGW
jgi:serine/threonine protein kinase/WD40 repeat protein